MTILVCDDCIWPDNDGAHLNGVIVSISQCERCGAIPGSLEVLDDEANDPHVVGGFQLEFSTCLALELHPPIIWDTNRYYASLGVDVRATKREIREAYQRLGGQDDPWLTYVTRQLLDDEVRRRYDSVELGRLFYDRMVADFVRRHQQLAMCEAIRDGLVQFDDGGAPVLSAEIAETHEVVVDIGDDDGQDAVSHRLRTIWPWAYYVWQTGNRNTWKLAQWQGALAKAFHNRGEVRRLAVGLIDSMEEKVWVEKVGYRIIVFLADGEQPTAELAELAAARVVQQEQEQQTYQEKKKAWRHPDSGRGPKPPKRPASMATSHGPTSSASKTRAGRSFAS